MNIVQIGYPRWTKMIKRVIWNMMALEFFLSLLVCFFMTTWFSQNAFFDFPALIIPHR